MDDRGDTPHVLSTPHTFDDLQSRTSALRAALGMVWRIHSVVVVALLAVALLEAIVIGVGVVLMTSALRVFFRGDGVRQLVVVVLSVVAAQQIASGARSAFSTILHQTAVAEISANVLAAVRRVPFEWIEDNEWQGSVGLALREASYRPGFLVDNFVSVVQATASLGGIFVAAVGILGPPVLLGPLLVVPVLALEVRLRRRLIEVQTGSAPDLMRMQYLAQMSVDSDWQRDLRTSASSVIEDEYRRLSARYLNRLRVVVLRTETWRAVAGIVAVAMLLSGVIILVNNVAPDRPLDPTFLTILLAVLGLSGLYIKLLVSSAGEVLSTAEYVRVLLSVLGTGQPDAGLHRPAPPSARPLPADQNVRIDDRYIELSHVSYRYRRRSRDALHDVNLVLRPGLTAVTGRNGAGKTTLVKILAGLLDPQAGEVCVRSGDGTTSDWRGVQRAVLFQNASHLRLSVRQNVTLSTADQSDHEDHLIWKALDGAGLSHTIQELPDGIETILGPGFGGAVDLSGGQWQRLALARVLYSDAPVLIYDEPATGLDVDGEARLMQHLLEQTVARFVIVVTHRPETIEQCNQVIVLDDGRLVANTNHRCRHGPELKSRPPAGPGLWSP